MAPERLGTLNVFADRMELIRGVDELLAIGKSERFEAYREILWQLERSRRSFPEMSPNERANVRHAMGEVQEAVRILHTLRSTPGIDKWEREVCRMLPGQLTPRGSRHFIELAGSVEQLAECNDPDPLSLLVTRPIEELRKDEGESEEQLKDEQPRNAAFELSLAILAQKADIVPMLDEPDWIFPTMFGGIAVAAKRVQSEGAIYRRLAEGAKQIERQIRKGAAVAGVAAIDLTLVLDLHRKHWIVRRESELWQLQAEIASAMNSRKARILKLGTERGISAVLLHAKALVFSRDTQRCTTVRPLLLGLVERESTLVSQWLTKFVKRVAK